MPPRALLLAVGLALLLAHAALAEVAGTRIASMMPGALAVTMMSPAQISRMAIEYNFSTPAKLLTLLRKDRDLHISPALKLAYKCASLTVRATARRSLQQEDGEEGQQHELAHEHEHEHELAHEHEHSEHEHHHHHDSRKLLQSGVLPAADPRQPLEQPGRGLQQAAANLVLQDPAMGSLTLGPSGVPILHSRPSATRKIYLDFDGHKTM
jgi:hypothetical protein